MSSGSIGNRFNGILWDVLAEIQQIMVGIHEKSEIMHHDHSSIFIDWLVKTCIIINKNQESETAQNIFVCPKTTRWCQQAIGFEIVAEALRSCRVWTMNHSWTCVVMTIMPLLRPWFSFPDHPNYNRAGLYIFIFDHTCAWRIDTAEFTY